MKMKENFAHFSLLRDGKKWKQKRSLIQLFTASMLVLRETAHAGHCPVGFKQTLRTRATEKESIFQPKIVYPKTLH